MQPSPMINLADKDRLQILELSAMANFSATLTAVIKLGVPDILCNRDPLPSSEILALIPECSTPQSSSANLDRLLRVLSSFEIFQESQDQDGIRRFGATPLSRYLVRNSSNAASVASRVLFMQEEAFRKSLNFLYESVTTGTDPFKEANGKPLFEFAASHPDFGGRFNSAMSANTIYYMRVVVQNYGGFQGLGCIVDVGGGTGTSLSLIIGHHPGVKGINFDQPHVVAKAPSFPGVEHVGGDMFREVPKGDLIFMKGVLHDWKDEDCLVLLKNCYKSLPRDGKLVVLDAVLPPSGANQGPGAQSALMLDIVMLTHCSGGKERTLEEFQSLAKAAGFATTEVILTVAHMSLMEMHK